MGIVAAVKRVLAEAPVAVPARPAAEPQRRAPAASFAAAPVAAMPTSRPSGAAADAPEAGWTRIADSFTVAQEVDAVWRFFGDLPRVANCLPGAVLEERDGTTLKGRMRVKLGPMTPSFAGTARLARDEAARSGLLEGSGGDETSNSRARGRLAYRLVPEGAGATRVELTLDFVLQGVLAQFGRSGLVRDVVGRMVQEFARNLSAALAEGETPTAPKPAAALDTGALFWRALWARILSLLGLGR
jgi:carbon-monoxide dehydrogenase small subunit